MMMTMRSQNHRSFVWPLTFVLIVWRRKRLETCSNETSFRLSVFRVQCSFQLEPRNSLAFHYSGCWIGMVVMVDYNPDVTVQHNPLYTLSNQGPVFHCSLRLLPSASHQSFGKSMDNAAPLLSTKAVCLPMGFSGKTWTSTATGFKRLIVMRPEICSRTT